MNVNATTQIPSSAPWRPRVFQCCFIAAGLGSVAKLAQAPPVDDWPAVLVWVTLTCVVALFGFGFPSPRGVFSLEWVCILTVLAKHGVIAASLVAVAAMLARQLRLSREHVRGGPADRISALFDVSLGLLAVQAGAAVLAMTEAYAGPAGLAAGLPLTALTMLLYVDLPRASAAALSKRRRLVVVWREESLWSIPFHLAGAALVGLILALHPLPTWLIAALGAPLFLLLSRSFEVQLGGLDRELRRAEEVTSLQTEMLEALAMAVEARESGGRPNLHRIGMTALLLGESLKLAPKELKALELAALLHDIGKMAVPDYILSKPGRLEPEEFERLKLHPVVAAEIVERAQFPYPVAPMIRAHHERWDGQGYPDGLAGSRIPLGARILAVVDALDALLSERKYRRALPLPRALEAIEREAGKAYDPTVVHALREHTAELESSLRAGESLDVQPPGFLTAIAEAHREEQQVQELLQDLNSSFDYENVLPMVETRLRRIVPHHSAAVWIRKDDRLWVAEALGDDRALLEGAMLPLGEGATGKAAHRRRALVNAAAGFEFSLLAGSAARHAGHKALAVPFVTDQGVPGVFTVYGTGEPEFVGRHARLLAAFAPRFASWIESARRYREAEEQASQDALTGLPNAAALYLQLQHEIARNARAGKRLAVLVTDLDGFKAVNDTFGHLAGNQVLQMVAAGLRERCREYDFVARMGGDEFVILLPGVGEDSIDDRVHSFALAVTEAGRRVCGHTAISLSVGVAYAPSDGTAPDELLARGDERMYVNKRLRKTRGPLSPDTAHAVYPNP